VQGEVVAVAIKFDGRTEAYGFTSDSYQAPDMCLPALKLPDEAYDVRVIARAGGISAERSFTLHNDGTAVTALRLEQS
jgi:hypothetical protein